MTLLSDIFLVCSARSFLGTQLPFYALQLQFKPSSLFRKNLWEKFTLHCAKFYSPQYYGSEKNERLKRAKKTNAYVNYSVVLSLVLSLVLRSFLCTQLLHRCDPSSAVGWVLAKTGTAFYAHRATCS